MDDLLWQNLRPYRELGDGFHLRSALCPSRDRKTRSCSRHEGEQLVPCAGIIFVVGLMPALFVCERYYQSETRTQARDPFWQSIRESLRCRPLWLLIGMSFFLVVGSSSVSALGQYVNIYYVCHGDIAVASIIGGWKGSVIVVTGILCIPFYTWLGERLDKKAGGRHHAARSLVGHLSNIVLMNPHHPYLQVIPGVFESAAISAIWLFVPSMKADIADYDELQTHRRREGALNAFYSGSSRRHSPARWASAAWSFRSRAST